MNKTQRLSRIQHFSGYLVEWLIHFPITGWTLNNILVIVGFFLFAVFSHIVYFNLLLLLLWCCFMFLPLACRGQVSGLNSDLVKPVYNSAPPSTETEHPEHGVQRRTTRLLHPVHSIQHATQLPDATTEVLRYTHPLGSFTLKLFHVVCCVCSGPVPAPHVQTLVPPAVSTLESQQEEVHWHNGVGLDCSLGSTSRSLTWDLTPPPQVMERSWLPTVRMWFS